jgi:hypothetical protein
MHVRDEMYKSQKVRDHSEDLSINRRIITKWILGKKVWRLWIRFIWLMIGTDCSPCKHSKEPSGSVIF